MKIVHLNTHAYGGAAVVARRLHRAGLAAGLDSAFITQYGTGDQPLPGQRALRSARLRELVRAGSGHPQVYALGKFIERRLQHRNLANRAPGFEVFTPINHSGRDHDVLDHAGAAVVHLHWVAGFADHAAFFRRNAGRRFVWTLHDMNPFTGGCHHADGCRGYEQGCAGCPQLAGTIDRDYSAAVLRAKVAALAPLADDQLVIVAPSAWLLELSRRSPVTARFRHEHIVNPTLDARPTETPAAFKLRHGLPRDHKIVLFISENLRNPRKGIALLFDAVRSMARHNEVHLVGIGRRGDAPADLAVTFTGRITDEATLAGYFAASDVVVNPSVMENSPLNIIEGLTFGTPAIGFGVGGIPELIGPGSGAVVTERSAGALAEALNEVLFGNNCNRDAIQRNAQQFAPARVLGRYRALYEELVAA